MGMFTSVQYNATKEKMEMLQSGIQYLEVCRPHCKHQFRYRQYQVFFWVNEMEQPLFPLCFGTGMASLHGMLLNSPS
jgi:hypothetical protein